MTEKARIKKTFSLVLVLQEAKSDSLTTAEQKFMQISSVTNTKLGLTVF